MDWHEVALQTATPQAILSPSRKYGLSSNWRPATWPMFSLAVADEVCYLRRRSPGPVAATPLLASEARHLRSLTARCGDRRYREYLPSLVETFTVPGTGGGRQANVFVYREGFYTLEAIRHRYPAGSMLVTWAGSSSECWRSSGLPRRVAWSTAMSCRRT